MKKYIYFIFAAAVVLAAGCQKKVDEAKELESRERVSIDVSYSVAGSAVTELSFSGAAARKVIDVKVNNDNLRWNLQSNRDWCRVLPGEHVGSGSVTIEIEANESFDSRDAATLLFTAGEYSGFELTVSQNRSVFLVDRIFSLSPIDGGAYEVSVSTEADLDWSYDSDSWLTVTKLGEDTRGDLKITTLRVSVSPNSSDSRLGEIRLGSSAGDGEICVYQFGNDLVYNEDGDIYYPVEVDADISFIAPSFTVRKVNIPKYAKASSVDNGNGTETFKIEFGHNYSDCNEDRIIPVTLTLNNKEETEIPMPAIVQGYEPAGSLMTAKGMLLFAKAVAEGGDTSPWEKDGVITMIEDIDLSEVEDWAGIGTEDHPFQGVFNGNNHTLSGLSGATRPVFNYLKGATVRNLIIHKSCSFSFASGKVVGGIAAVAEGTAFENCVFGGVLEYSGKEQSPLVGGIAGSADESSSFSFCKNSGRLVLSSEAVASTVCSVGGILADGPANVSDCEFSGVFECGSSYESVDFGGIVASLSEGNRVSGNSFTGSVRVESTIRNLAIGGLYGHVKSGSWVLDHDSDRSMAGGSITIVSFADNTDSRIYAGGFIGLLGESVNLSVKGFTTMTSFVLDKSINIQKGVYLNCGGVLGSCEPDAPGGDIQFENITNQGIFNILVVNTVANQIRRGCVGGVAGFVRGTVKFINCSNLAEIGYNELYCANSNGHTIVIGGIAGMGIGGNMTFTGCVNKGKLSNPQYNNNGAWDSEKPTDFVYGNFMTACCTGGIVGAYNFKQSPESKNIVFDNCSNTADIWAYRGYVGGIAGFAQNATFTNCSWRGNSPGDNSNQAAFKGGIAGGLASATLSGCTARVTLVSHRGGSAQDGDAGGIVARVLAGSPVSLTGCSFYGRLGFSSATEEDRRFAGGMVAVAQSNTVVRDSRYGGNIGGSPVTANTVKEKAVGKGNCTVEGITYWDGK